MGRGARTAPVWPPTQNSAPGRQALVSLLCGPRLSLALEPPPRPHPVDPTSPPLHKRSVLGDCGLSAHTSSPIALSPPKPAPLSCTSLLVSHSAPDIARLSLSRWGWRCPDEVSACTSTLSGLQPQGLAQAGPGQPAFWMHGILRILAFWTPSDSLARKL